MVFESEAMIWERDLKFGHDLGTRFKIKKMVASLWAGNMTQYLKDQLAHEGQWLLNLSDFSCSFI